MKLALLTAIVLFTTGAISRPNVPRASLVARQSSPATAAGPFPSAGAICASQCSSSSDQALLAQLSTVACDASPSCICGTLEAFSLPCVTCLLGAEGATITNLEGVCGSLNLGTTTTTIASATPSQAQSSSTTSVTPTSSPTSSPTGARGIFTSSSSNTPDSSGTASGYSTSVSTTISTSTPSGSAGNGESSTFSTDSSSSSIANAPTNSSPAAGRSAAGPTVDIKVAMVVLTALVAGVVLLM
ncbi:hypothetical protein DACRYDRAFT_104432 [Dacryopinax primogenitus]|uniref:Extracellular membrane protein CFEM domain-containing protein n=1 Tax=Dacryopinax primogenitus (strain DJM 731) TaxID=1858805 RepID=M5GDI2_DACPD|nr:uncharacterized protein DACRYDRAFT_104432 [Dacryopinax primogenitus]EJU04552.1 hypothetical protein DACRYDRAFT_104432 [Dacryopinax primogenitus]